MVSVIIPTYNRSRMVIEAIQSVLNQTCRDFEIIVVDDASSDNTYEVIQKKFNDAIAQRILRYFKNEQHRERSFSRNRGIKEARGDCLAFLDDDDLFLPVHLEICLAAMRAVDAVATDIVITDSDRQPIYKHSYPFSNKLNPNELVLFGFGMCSSNAMIRKEVIAKIGMFREDTSEVEDIDFFMRVAMKSSIRFLKKETVLRRKYQHCYTSDDTSRIMNLRYLEGLKNLLLENANAFSYQLSPKIMGYLHLYLAGNGIVQFKRRYALKCLIDAIRAYPRLVATEPFVLFILVRMVYMWNKKVYVFLKRIKQPCPRRV